MSEQKRLHPAVILFDIWKVLKEFLFFIIPGFVILSGKVLVYYLLILLGCFIIIIIFITISWYRYTYRIEKDELRIEQGIFVRNKRYISKHRIQSIDLTQSVLHRVLNVVKVEIQTAGGGKGAEALLQAVPKQEGERLRNDLKHFSEPSIKSFEHERPSRPSEKISNKRLWIAGSTSGGFGAVLAVLAVVFSKLEQIIPVEIVNNIVEWIMRTSIVLMSGFILILLFILWVLGVMGTVIKYGNFTITKDDDELLITRGLLEKKQLTIPLRRIQAIGMKENLVRQPLGYVSVFAKVAGGSLESGEDFSTVLFPIMKRSEVERFLQIFVPTHAEVEERPLLKLPKRARKYYLFRSMLPALAIMAGLLYAIPDYFGLSIVLVVCSIFFGSLQHQDGGFCLHGERLTIRYRTFSKVTMRIHRKRIQAFEMKQHKLQRLDNLATIKVSIIGMLGSGNHYTIKELDDEEARSIAEWYSFQTE